MDIKILAVGSLDKPFLVTGCAMFLERTKHYAKIELIEVKEITNKNEQVAINEQTTLVTKKLLDYPDYYKVLLNINGQQLTSDKIAALIADVKHFKKAKLMFIIGGSHGFNTAIQTEVAFQLSFGAITLPHQLCRLILLEQIYRGFKIINNEVYHK
ncbi:23S rRNA (pseudouridine(1915)-N(3))-methyltransferase RlmH [Spiroplasma sp. SV19]|uniref:23S rRNA (pseudouridine(1915)-N(3))-methyltransferase RlmH n=1 Tax=Spiroplasma sp. SV19 TaxID=2570468 RepID=UPI0024B736FA|nr:23S rRNA (pseudouridine(1915)-N(3))-methyltransferase RlmH [Spiroplasma sp. SV19]WHQ36894.1 23S rRNA (pseudouridine(1915)-N(3))-methyltransferase RlmH [Spiroplasma sp. SV19]